SRSETAPTQGTLKLFPDVLLSNAYLILRPFFRPLVATDSPDILNAKNWTFDISYAEFPGIVATNGGWHGPRPTPEMHPHLRLDDTITSVPKVNLLALRYGTLCRARAHGCWRLCCHVYSYRSLDTDERGLHRASTRKLCSGRPPTGFPRYDESTSV
ncbi:hypothetical protein BDZ89DRAFT_1232418, partial [Hymenopellis radicata]